VKGMTKKKEFEAARPPSYSTVKLSHLCRITIQALKREKRDRSDKWGGRTSGDSKLCTGDVHFDLVILRFARSSDLSLFFSFFEDGSNQSHLLYQAAGRTTITATGLKKPGSCTPLPFNVSRWLIENKAVIRGDKPSVHCIVPSHPSAKRAVMQPEFS